MRDEVQQFANLGDVVLYGVGSRSSNFVNILGIGSSISYAVDDQPEKQFKRMPHSGLEILPSSELASRSSNTQLALLGVNGEDEEAVINNPNFPSNIYVASVLPPSPRLLMA